MLFLAFLEMQIVEFWWQTCKALSSVANCSKTVQIKTHCRIKHSNNSWVRPICAILSSLSFTRAVITWVTHCGVLLSYRSNIVKVIRRAVLSWRFLPLMVVADTTNRLSFYSLPLFLSISPTHTLLCHPSSRIFLHHLSPHLPYILLFSLQAHVFNLPPKCFCCSISPFWMWTPISLPVCTPLLRDQTKGWSVSRSVGAPLFFSF